MCQNNAILVLSDWEKKKVSKPFFTNHIRTSPDYPFHLRPFSNPNPNLHYRQLAAGGCHRRHQSRTMIEWVKSVEEWCGEWLIVVGD